MDTSCVDRPKLRARTDAEVHHVELGERLEAGQFKAVFVWDHNPVVTLPDAERVRSGLQRAGTFTVVHELFLTETAAVADVVLPAASFLEQNDVYTSFGHRVLQFGRASCRAPGEARGNVAAFAGIARALQLPREVWDVTDEALCFELLETQRARLSHADFEELLEGKPVKLPARERTSWGTESGKIELANDDLEPPLASYIADQVAVEAAPERGAFALLSAPSVATHNSTYLHSARHRAKAGEPRCFVHPQDAEQLGVGEGDSLRLSNERGALTLKVVVNGDGRRGAIRVDGVFRAQDVPEGIGINALVSPVTSAQAHASTLCSTRVDAERVD